MMPMEPDITAILDKIRAFRRKRKLSINALAKAAEVPWSVLQGMDEPGWSPSLKTLNALLAAMKRHDGAPVRNGKSEQPRPRAA
jgi:predicted transcriptional regulator